MSENMKIKTKKHDDHTDFFCMSCKVWLHGNKEAMEHGKKHREMHGKQAGADAHSFFGNHSGNMHDK